MEGNLNIAVFGNTNVKLSGASGNKTGPVKVTIHVHVSAPDLLPNGEKNLLVYPEPSCILAKSVS